MFCLGNATADTEQRPPLAEAAHHSMTRIRESQTERIWLRMSAGMPSLPEYVLTHPVKQRPTQMPAGPSVRIRSRHKCLQMCKCRRACKCANVRKYANFGECWRMAANVRIFANVGKCGRRRTRRRNRYRLDTTVIRRTSQRIQHAPPRISYYIGAQKKCEKNQKKSRKNLQIKKTVVSLWCLTKRKVQRLHRIKVHFFCTYRNYMRRFTPVRML